MSDAQRRSVTAHVLEGELATCSLTSSSSLKAPFRRVRVVTPPLFGSGAFLFSAARTAVFGTDSYTALICLSVHMLLLYQGIFHRVHAAPTGLQTSGLGYNLTTLFSKLKNCYCNCSGKSFAFLYFGGTIYRITGFLPDLTFTLLWSGFGSCRQYKIFLTRSRHVSRLP